ncbi:uncharacterized protein Fot_24450 [Forsythia ovata]|uniref:Uncharacterized protein n=1 Tax=Forsythia ovata TaxID=205694 RepID=A0ABD1U697_9LAMI
MTNIEGNDNWQDLEIHLENDVRLQANDDNEVDEHVVDYWDGMDISADDQNVESLAGNSKNTTSSYSSGPEVWAFEAILCTAHLFRAQIQKKKRLPRMCLWNSRLTPESRDIAEVLDDPQLRVRCTLHASPKRGKEEYVRLFVSGADGAVGDEEDIFEQVLEDDPSRSPVAQDEHEAGQLLSAAAPHVPLRRSRPCYEHGNILRQILEQIKKLTNQVDELKRKVDMLEKRRQYSLHLHGEYIDDDR